jgi:hypothetical protein
MKKLILILLLIASPCFALTTSTQKVVSAGGVAVPGAGCSTTVCAADGSCGSGYCSGTAATCMANAETCTYKASTESAGATLASATILDSYYTAVKSTSVGLAGLGFSYDANFSDTVASGNTGCTSQIYWSCCTGTDAGTCNAASYSYSAATTNAADYAEQATAGSQFIIEPDSMNFSCTASTAPYSCCTGAGTGTCPTVKAFATIGTKYLSLHTLPTFLQGANSLLSVVSGFSSIPANAVWFAYTKGSDTAGLPFVFLLCEGNKYLASYHDKDFTHYSESYSATATNTSRLYLYETTATANWLESNAKVNGGTSITATSAGNASATGQDTAYIGAGKWNNALAGQWRGKIIHVEGWKSQLSADDMTIMRNWLKTTYPIY